MTEQNKPDDLALDLGEDPAATPAPVSTTSDPAPVDDDQADDDVDEVDPEFARHLDADGVIPLGEGVDEERVTGRLGLYDLSLLKYVATGLEVSSLFDSARAQGLPVDDDVERFTVRRV